jgi:hypothetical protein
MKTRILPNTKIFLVLCIVVFAAFIALGCVQPSPLYGKWADNRGDSITFINDGTFVAAVVDYASLKTTYDGDYTVLLNSLVLSCSNGKQIVTEWDIRGNMLYLDWTTDDGDLLSMTLYKTSN